MNKIAFLFALALTLLLCSSPSAEAFGHSGVNRFFSVQRSYAVPSLAVVDNCQTGGVSGGVPFQAPFYADPALSFAPSYGVASYGVSRTFAPGYGTGFYSVQRSFAPGYGVSRYDVHRSATAFVPVRGQVVSGGSTVVVNQQRGLFGNRSSTVVANTGISGGTTVVNQQRGLFGRSSTTVVTGNGAGATVVNQRRR